MPTNQISECDSPLVLTNYTLDYIDKHWADQVDFVICGSMGELW